MAADIITINYEVMGQIVREFLDEQARVNRIIQRLNNQIEVLEGGAWKSEAATAYYRDMETDLMPAMRRLTESLFKASLVTHHIITIFEGAEEDASSLLQRAIDGVGTPYADFAKEVLNFLAGKGAEHFAKNKLLSKYLQIQIGRLGHLNGVRSFLAFRESGLARMIPAGVGEGVGYVIDGLTGEHNWTDTKGIASASAAGIKTAASFTGVGAFVVGALEVNQLAAKGAAAGFQAYQEYSGTDMSAWVRGAQTYGDYTSLDKAIEVNIEAYNSMTSLRQQLGGTDQLIDAIDKNPQLSTTDRIMAKGYVYTMSIFE